LICGFAALAFLSRALRGVARFARSPLLRHTGEAGAYWGGGSRLSSGRRNGSLGRCEASWDESARPCLVRSRWHWRQWSCGGFLAEAPHMLAFVNQDFTAVDCESIGW